MSRGLSVFCLASLFVIASSFSCLAASGAVQPTYYTVRAVPPDGYNNTFALRFEMDQTACLKAYGNGWQKVCTAAPSPEGAPADLQIVPAVEGSWIWEENSSLVFRPAKPWQPEKSYTVTLGKGSVVPEIRLKSATVKFSTPPLAAIIDGNNLWIDPGPEGKHGLSFAVSFNYPVPAMPDARLFTLEVAAPARGLELDKTEYVWSRGARTSVSVSASVKRLGDEAGVVSFAVNGLPAIRRTSNGEIAYGENPRERMRVPGKKGFLAISDVKLDLSLDDKMRQEYRLALDFNAMMRVEDVLKSIRVFQLPRTRTPEALEPFVWSKAPYISLEDIEKATPLKVEAVSNVGEISSKVVLRIAPSPDSYIAAIVPDNLFSPAGLSTARSEIRALHAPSLIKSLSFLQSGNVLALSSDKKISLMAQELDHIRWTAYQVRPEFISLAATQNSALSRLLDTELRLAVATSGRCDLPAPGDGRPQFATLDMAPLLADGKKGVMELEVAGFVKKSDGTLQIGIKERRFILLTDLGLVVKKSSQGERDVFVCSLGDGKAVDGANVEVLGANGLPVFKTVSDSGGRARIPSLSGLRADKDPTVIVVTKGGDMTYLPLEGSGLELVYGRFAASGRVGLGNDSLIAHVFSQRGMFRPGETLHFGMVVRKADWSALPDSLPLQAELWDTTGRKLTEKAVSISKDGLCEFSWPLAESAVSGVYRLDVRIPGSPGVVIGSRAVRVEEFQPDTLSIKAAFKPEPARGWIKADKLRAEISLLNMTGLPAQDRKVIGTVEVYDSVPGFSGYPEYFFYQSAADGNTGTSGLSLPDKRTDAGGKAEFDINLKDFAREVMTVDLTFTGFEPGDGRSVQTEKRLLVSQRDYVVGVKTASNLHFLPQGRDAVLELVALDPDLKAIDPGVLNVITAKRRHISALVNDRGRLRHESVAQDTEIARHDLRFAGDGGKGLGAKFSLFTGEPGDYVATFYNKLGQIVSSVTYSVAGKSLRPQRGLAAGKLNLRLEKDDYDSGDVIQLALTVPFDGVGLLTIERDTVLVHKWFRAEAGECVQQIGIPQDFAGKGYVNVSFARSLSSPDIYTQPLAFAVAPFTANIKARDLGLQLEAESLIKPGRNLPVTVKAREKGRAVVFVVDEGVLQLTGFRTPSPLDDLLADRGLDVRTSQNLSLLMPDNRLLQGMLPAFGGGFGTMGGKFHNPFKRKNEPPVAYWSSVIDVSPEGAKVDVPIAGYYNGKVRVMAVGSSGSLTGSAETVTAVRDDIILTPQIPVIAAPGDSFEAGVGVANNLPGGGEAKILLKYECEGSISIDGPQEAEITLGAGNEGIARFAARVGEEPGPAAVRVIAVAGDGKFRTVREATLSVRPASPRMSSLQAGQTRESRRLETGRRLFSHEAVSQASVSSLPLPLAHSLIRYLDGYPYGCMEQLISKAFPYVLLLGRPELLSGSGEPVSDIRERGEKIINNAVAAIQASLSSRRGGLALWEGMPPNTLLTAYAADFLLEARAAGFGAPAYLENQLLDALEELIVRSSADMAEARAKSYGIWALTRGGRIAADSLAALVKFLDGDVPGRKGDVTSSLLAGSLNLLKIRQADTLVRDFKADAAQFQDAFFDPLAAVSLHIAVLARHFPDILNADRQETQNAITDLLRVTVNALRAGKYSSFSAAQSIRAIMALADRRKPASGEVNLACVSRGIVQKKTATDLTINVDAPGCEEFALDLPSDNSGWFWQVYADGYDRQPPDRAVTEGLEISVDYTDDDGRAVDEVPLGSEVTVRVTAKVFDKALDNVAITVLLPGGFEMVLPRGGSDSRRGTDEDDEESAEREYGEEQLLWANHIDRREDRMLIFTTLDTGKKLFAYRVKAVNKGVFTLPPAYAEGMYSRNIRGNSAAGVIRVK